MILIRDYLSRTLFGRKAFWILVAAFVMGKIFQELTGSSWPFWVLMVMGGAVFVFDVFRWMREMTMRDLQRCGYPRQSDPPPPASTSTTKNVDTHGHD